MASKSQAFTADGTFTVPAGVSLVWLMMIGGGSSGGQASTSGPSTGGGAGGSAGELCIRRPLTVTPGATIAISIGSGGVAGTGPAIGGSGDTLCAYGGHTTFGTTKALGANSSPSPSNHGYWNGGCGGGPCNSPSDASGVRVPVVANGGITDFSLPTFGRYDSPCSFIGCGGGALNSGGDPGDTGASSAGRFGGAGGSSGSGVSGGGGGGASIFGNGGRGGSVGGLGSTNGQSYGAGGGGNANGIFPERRTSSNGASGYCLVTWCA